MGLPQTDGEGRTVADECRGADTRLRLLVVGGFLGSGKTTWLRHQLRSRFMSGFRDSDGTIRPRQLRSRFGPKTVVLVNEFAGHSVDDVLLAARAEVRVIAGGCVCCDARGELRLALREIVNERHGSAIGQRVERVVLETSGLADPAPVLDVIASDPVLRSNVLVEELVVTLDAIRGREQLRSERLGRAQISLADRIVVTKVDQVDPDGIAATVATARRLNPAALISGADRGVSSALPNAWAAADALPELEGSPDLRPVAIELPVDAGTDWPLFTVWLSALLHAHGERVLRVKGVVPTPAGLLVLQCVGSTVQVPELLPVRLGAQPATGVVMISRGLNVDAVARSFNAFIRH